MSASMCCIKDIMICRVTQATRVKPPFSPFTHMSPYSVTKCNFLDSEPSHPVRVSSTVTSKVIVSAPAGPPYVVCPYKSWLSGQDSQAGRYRHSRWLKNFIFLFILIHTGCVYTERQLKIILCYTYCTLSTPQFLLGWDVVPEGDSKAWVIWWYTVYSVNLIEKVITLLITQQQKYIVTLLVTLI